ncbi:MAG: DNA adenine methylase [Proteobacteria bacterium]|nr:DNA adenine methylase [Pseudomonadota bacterium]
MTTKTDRVLAQARVVLADYRIDLEKHIWGSPAGKFYLAEKLVPLIPAHKIYVEPFAGGAQVLFRKEPTEVEVVNDMDPEIAFAFRFASKLTKRQLDNLRHRNWTSSRHHFNQLKEKRPVTDLERFYRFLYVSRFSWDRNRRDYAPANAGVTAQIIPRLERYVPRIRTIKVRCTDYGNVIREFDGKDTFFFLDPPYKAYDALSIVGPGHRDWDEERFLKTIRRIRGKFLVTYGTRSGPGLFQGFHVRRVRHRGRVKGSTGGSRELTTLVVTNFQP